MLDQAVLSGSGHHAKISGPTLARVLGVTDDVLRDWRRRGLLDGFGEQGPNGRWRYSKHDVERLLQIAKLSSVGFAFGAAKIIEGAGLASVVLDALDAG